MNQSDHHHVSPTIGYHILRTALAVLLGTDTRATTPIHEIYIAVHIKGHQISDVGCVSERAAPLVFNQHNLNYFYINKINLNNII